MSDTAFKWLLGLCSTAVVALVAAVLSMRTDIAEIKKDVANVPEKIDYAITKYDLRVQTERVANAFESHVAHEQAKPARAH